MQIFVKIKDKIIAFYNVAKPRLLRSDVYMILLPTFGAFLFLLFVIPLLFNNSQLQFQIEQKISSELKANLQIAGKIDLALLPSPSISASDVILLDYNNGKKNYSFYAKNIKINLSFLSCLIGKFAVDKITFSSTILQKYNLDNKPEANKDAFTEAISKFTPTKDSGKSGGGISGRIFSDIFKMDNFSFANFNKANLPKIIIKNSSLINYDGFLNQLSLNNINALASFAKKKILAEGSFVNQEIINNFHLKLFFEQKLKSEFDEKNNSLLELNSTYGDFKIIGIFYDQNNGIFNSKFKGKIEADIFNVKNFYKSYVSNEGFVYNKINSDIKPIKIRASIVNDGGQITVNNVVISSNIINGRGNIAIDLAEKLPIIDVHLSLENIDFDSIWLSDKDVTIKDEKLTIDAANQSLQSATANQENPLTLNLAKDLRDFDLTVELTVSSVQYLDEEIKNVNLYTSISKQGEILILPLTLQIPGGGFFRIDGVLENRSTPKFVGSLDLSGSKLSDVFKWWRVDSQNLIYDNFKEYSLYADILMTPGSTILNNIYLNINNSKTELLGEAYIRYNAKTSNILSEFHVGDFIVDDYFLTSSQNIYLTPGNLLKKLLWLNNLSSNNDLSLTFDKLSYKGNIFNDQSAKFRFGQGYFEVTDLRLKSDSVDLAASLAIDISDNIPKFNIAINAANFSHQSLKIDNNQKFNAFDQFYSLPSLEGLHGDILLNLDNASFDNFSAKNIKISGKLRDGIINFSNFSADLYSGNLTYTGVVGFKFDKALSGNVTLNEISLQPFLNDIFAIKNINGIANISASIENAAGAKKDFLKNLNSQIKVGASSVSVENYGLNDLIKKMFNAKNYANELLDLEKILFNHNAKTNFKSAIGTISFTKNQDDIFKFDLETVASNAIFSGKIDPVKNALDATLNVIFLTGNAKKQIPLNIASNLRGNLNDLQQSSNLDQAKQYLRLPNGNVSASPSNTSTERFTESSVKQELPTSLFAAPHEQNPALQGSPTTQNNENKN